MPETVVTLTEVTDRTSYVLAVFSPNFLLPDSAKGQ
jgi:hypothetical protein